MSQSFDSFQNPTTGLQSALGLFIKCLHLVMVEVMQGYFGKPENNYASLEFLS